MSVPFIDLKRVALLAAGAAQAEWQRLVANAEFMGGPSVAAFEQELATALGAKHAISCGNGTDALCIGLQALGVRAGHKVALPNLTFWASYEGIAQLGATPLLIDVNPQTLQMDFEALKRAHRQLGFDAVVLVHLLGWATPELFEFRDFCRQNSVLLLEDGAQSFGVQVGGKSVYAGASAVTLSFYPAKVLGGCMDGGALLTDDAETAARFRNLCNHGRTAHYAYGRVGWNSRMGALHAEWLRAMLKHAGDILKERRALETAYQGLFAELPDVITPYSAPRGVLGNGYLAVAALKHHEPQVIAERLQRAGIGTGRVYPETLDVQPPATAALRYGDLAVGRAFCARVLNLPLFYGMTREEFAEVSDALRRALRD
jgi:UDP-2-acetamido-2-deoxy-ribo-hexuluronate aminotransferase